MTDVGGHARQAEVSASKTRLDELAPELPFKSVNSG
jgi:hypothetical protein